MRSCLSVRVPRTLWTRIPRWPLAALVLISLSNGLAASAQQPVTVEPAPQDAGTPTADDGQADADDDGRDEKSGGDDGQAGAVDGDGQSGAADDGQSDPDDGQAASDGGQADADSDGGGPQGTPRVAISTDQPAPAGGGDAGSQLVTQGEATIGIDTDSFVELPFDRPFTMTVSFENLELRGTTPTLTYLDFPRRLDVIPKGVCDSEEPRAKAATFAGVTHETENGKAVSKVRFFITGVLPNRYWLFCFDSSAAITLELGARAKEDLQNEIKAALWRFDSEIETKERELLNHTIRDILDSAVQRFARNEGISGTLRISKELPAHDLAGAVLDVRRAIQECDPDDLARTLDAAESVAPEIADRRRSAAATGRASMADCLELLRFSRDRISTAEIADAERQTILSRIDRSLGRLENGQSEFAAKSMRVLQQSRVLILASSIGGDSAAQRYVSADTGLAYVPDLDRSVPYMGINLYLRPVNPPSVTPLGSGQQGNFVQRFSITLAFTVGNDLVQEETLGGQTVKFVDNWTDAGSLLVGVGYRLNPAIRVGAGAIAYRQLDSLVDLRSGADTEVSFYFSVSLDVNVRSFFRQDAGKLFSGGTPTGEGQGN